MTVKSLMEAQVGKEVTWGTSVAGTARLMGVTNVVQTPTVNSKIIKDLRANLVPGYIGVVGGVEAAATVEGVATYEDLSYPLESLFGVVTPSGGPVYIYAGAAPTAAPTSRIHTLLWGNAAGTHKLEGGLGKSLTIRGASGPSDTELTYTWELLGKDIITASLAALSDRTVNPIMCSHAAVALDTWAGTMGSTPLATTAISFELKLDAALIMKRYLGSLFALGHERERYEVEANTLTLSMELNAGSLAIADALIAAAPALTQRQIRLTFTDTTRIAQFNFAGTLLAAPTLYSDVNGIVTIDTVWSATYNPTFANWFTYSISNGVATLP
jgi:hypothetical protein